MKTIQNALYRSTQPQTIERRLVLGNPAVQYPPQAPKHQIFRAQAACITAMAQEPA
jgi:hypothetical protein